MHEAVFEDFFLNGAGALGQDHEGHDLGLHVGGKTGIGAGGHVHAAQVAAAADGDAVFVRFEGYAHFAHFGHDGGKLLDGAAFDVAFAAGDGGGGQKGAGLDAVGHDGIGSAA